MFARTIVVDVDAVTTTVFDVIFVIVVVASSLFLRIRMYSIDCAIFGACFPAVSTVEISLNVQKLAGL